MEVTMKYILLIAGIFGIDFSIKDYIEKNKEFHKEEEICNGIFILTKHHNSGAACDCMTGKRDLLLSISGIMLGIVTALLAVVSKKRGKQIAKLGYCLILGGGFSNMYDRISKGYVVDYFKFAKAPSCIRKLIFNIADIAIVIGCILALCAEIFKKSEEI